MYQALNNIGLDSTRDLHIYALGISGIVLLFMGIAGFGATVGSRVLSVLVGLAALGYAAYLGFIQDPTSDYWVSYYVYILPVLLIINAFRSAKANRAAAQQNQQPPAA